LRVVPAGKEEESDELDRRAETGAYAGLETVRQRKNGSLVDVEVSVAPIRDAESTVVSFMAVYRDITERKRQERELQASRARIVQAGDAERRRLERNLHDGAQQRLVTLSLALRLAESRLESDANEARRILGGANEELALALAELRELARGIHPAVLTDRGLGPALEALAVRAPLPVELVGVPAQRLPEPVEAAAYYLVAEALTNVAKYARASAVTIRVTRENGRAVVDITDNGIGGADPTRGSGLRGLLAISPTSSTRRSPRPASTRWSSTSSLAPALPLLPRPVRRPSGPLRSREPARRPSPGASRRATGPSLS
jgi:signal transduction histidine kinase